MSYEPSPISAPGQFVPIGAISFGSLGESATEVTMATPLPVSPRMGAAALAPVAGVTGATTIVGPFVPELARPVVLTLAGTWSGAVRLLRSVDGGTTRPAATLFGEPLAWSANLQEPVWSETELGATLWLALEPVSGTIAYRIAQ